MTDPVGQINIAEGVVDENSRTDLTVTPKKTWKRKMPKVKAKIGRHANGSDRKSATTRVYNRTMAVSHTPATVPPSRLRRGKRKMSQLDIEKANHNETQSLNNRLISSLIKTRDNEIGKKKTACSLLNTSRIQHRTTSKLLLKSESTNAKLNNTLIQMVQDNKESVIRSVESSKISMELDNAKILHNTKMQQIKSLSTQKHKHEESMKRQSSCHAKEILSQSNEHQKEINTLLSQQEEVLKIKSKLSTKTILEHRKESANTEKDHKVLVQSLQKTITNLEKSNDKINTATAQLKEQHALDLLNERVVHENELKAQSQQNSLHLLAQASEQVLIRDAMNEKHTSAITAFSFENERLAKKFKSEMSAQSKMHKQIRATTAKEYRTTIKGYRDYAGVQEAKAQSFLENNERLERKVTEQKDTFDLRAHSDKRSLQKVQAEAIKKKDMRLCNLQTLVCEKRDMILMVSADAKVALKQNNKTQKESLDLERLLTDRVKRRKAQAASWKKKYEDLSNEIANVSNENDDLTEQLIEWKKIAQDMEQQYEANFQSARPLTIRKKWVKNIGKKGGHMEWLPHVEKLILEMLANRTPPTCIQSNIIAFCGHILPGQDVVKEVPSVKHIKNMRTVQLTIAKTLAAMRVGKSIKIKQVHSDETSKRQAHITNVVVGLLQADNTLKTICLAGDLICADGTAEEQSKGVIQSFSDGGRLLERWYSKTVKMYENDDEKEDLLIEIPRKESLSVCRLLGCYLTTDSCNAAKLFQSITSESILAIARESGITNARELVVFSGYCHNHLRNIWVKALSARLKTRLEEEFKDDLDDIPFIYRVTFDLMNIHRCIDKECNETAHYFKGHGVERTHWLEQNHPGLLSFPITRTLGGDRQDVVFEACLGSYYMRPYHIKWLTYAMSTMDNENILQRAMFIQLTSREMVAQLRVGAIFFMSVIVPMRWLAGNTHLLEHRKWGEADMCMAVDLVYNTFLKVETNGRLMLRESFIMKIFKPLYKKLPELEEYLDWYFEEKETQVFGSMDADSRKKGIKIVKSEIFSPVDPDNRATHDCACWLSEDLAATLSLEMADPRKITKDLINKLDGDRCKKNTTAAQRKAGLGIRANNDPAEQNFAVFDDALNQMGRGSLERAAGQSMSRYNHDMDRDTSELVTGRKSKADKDVSELGLFHTLCKKLQDSLLATAKDYFDETHADHIQKLNRQRERKAEKKEAARVANFKTARKKFKESSWLHQQYKSPRCWTTRKQALDEFQKLPSHTQQLKYVKEQIHMRYLGCGWEKAHHPWSRKQHTYTATELLEHLMMVVIPLSRTHKYPDDAPFELPGIPTLPTLGTQTNDVEIFYKQMEDEKLKSMLDALKEREREEVLGIGDQSEYMNAVNWPEKLLKKGYQIEKLFMYLEEDEEKMIWVPGVVLKVLSKNKDKITALVKWDKEVIAEGEADESEEELKKNMWNPSKPKAGAWRQDLRYLRKDISN